MNIIKATVLWIIVALFAALATLAAKQAFAESVKSHATPAAPSSAASSAASSGSSSLSQAIAGGGGGGGGGGGASASMNSRALALGMATGANASTCLVPALGGLIQYGDDTCEVSKLATLLINAGLSAEGETLLCQHPRIYAAARATKDSRFCANAPMPFGAGRYGQ